MDHKEAGAYWEQNAEAWTLLARSGYDIYRDYLNTPAFFGMLPDVAGQKGLDIGCGEGYNTRLLASRGAHMWAIDISPTFIEKAIEMEALEPTGVRYQVASAVELPFGDKTFDFATGFMSFMDVPELEKVISEAFRVLKPGGFLQISITHPCFDLAHRKNIRGSDGKTYAIEVGNYFSKTEGEIDEWIFKSTPEPLRSSLPKFKTPRFTRTLSEWLNLFIDSGFDLEQLQEPRPDDETVARQPKLQDSQVVAYFLHIRCRKPFTSTPKIETYMDRKEEHTGKPVFGVPEEGISYRLRPGAYAVIYNQQGEICLVRVPSGYALPGGGIEGEEIKEEALLREVYEETGFGVKLLSFLGTAFHYKLSDTEGYVKKDCFYYACAFAALERESVEKDHFPEWWTPAAAIERLGDKEPAHRWAVQTFLASANRVR